MDDIYFLWNTFNLVFILSGIFVGGILVGGIINSIISMMTQIEDSGSGFFLDLLGFLYLPIYFLP